MTESQSTTEPGRSRPSRRAPRHVVAAGVGLFTGGLAAWSYYHDPFRPLAHTFGLWITAVTLVVAKQSTRRAVVAACLCLAVAVLTFYTGLKVMYDSRYPGGSYTLSLDQVALWLVLAAVAGSGLALILRWAGRPGALGAIGVGAAVGLLIADAYRRVSYPNETRVIVVVGGLEMCVVLIATVRSLSQLWQAALWAVPAAVVGTVAVSAPDMIEQWLITHG